MLYNLINFLRPWLTRHGLYGYTRVLTYSEFRALMAVIFSFAYVLIFGKRTIRWLLKLKIGDNPEFHNKSLNELMKHKSNTPTMGGILISGAILSATLLLADVTSFYVLMGLICLLWLFAMGLFDDRLKLISARRKPGSRDGLHSWEKLVLQLGLAVVLGIFIHDYGRNKYAHERPEILDMSRSLTLPLAKSWVYDPVGKNYLPSPDLIKLGTGAFVILAIVVITGASNAVNLTDGMDGLASGIMSIVSFAFMMLALIAGRDDNNGALAKFLLVPYIPQSDELAIMAGSMCGACLGFLWYNCNPALVFMGDTGSLPLGGLIGYIAVVIRQEFLLLIIGGVFVMEALSVMLQVGYFKFTKGKRIFKCAPIHHHFHLSGWTEQQVVVRFWLLSIILAAVALATIKLR